LGEISQEGKKARREKKQRVLGGNPKGLSSSSFFPSSLLVKISGDWA
jgi:hypothetical protein